MTADYTPTMEEVSIGYTLGRMGMVLTESAMEEFDRALAVHDAEVESRGADRERARLLAEVQRVRDGAIYTMDIGDAVCASALDWLIETEEQLPAIEAGEHLGGTDD